jgi:hypothetical protein
LPPRDPGLDLGLPRQDNSHCLWVKARGAPASDATALFKTAPGSGPGGRPASARAPVSRNNDAQDGAARVRQLATKNAALFREGKFRAGRFGEGGSAGDHYRLISRRSCSDKDPSTPIERSVAGTGKLVLVGEIRLAGDSLARFTPMAWRELMTSTQCRKARALIGWSHFDLAARSKVDVSTVRNFETRRSRLGLNNRRAMQAALEAAGIVIGRDGVRRRKKPRLSPAHSFQLARLG